MTAFELLFVQGTFMFTLFIVCRPFVVNQDAWNNHVTKDGPLNRRELALHVDLSNNSGQHCITSVNILIENLIYLYSVSVCLESFHDKMDESISMLLEAFCVRLNLFTIALSHNSSVLCVK